ncbi:unnamed protein product, partial [Pocillopora meandrina]
LSVVRDGHKIPFVTLSPLKVIPNNLSAVTYSHFVSEAISDFLTVRADLTSYGFVINEEKSLREPVQVISWLGTVFDTYQCLISVTERRFSKLKSSIDLLRKDDCKIFKVRDVASVVGQVISLTPCV